MSWVACRQGNAPPFYGWQTACRLGGCKPGGNLRAAHRLACNLACTGTPAADHSEWGEIVQSSRGTDQEVQQQALPCRLGR
eukprot:scaffold41153_cov46-Phaeocystis_antarctica.AAC.4